MLPKKCRTKAPNLDFFKRRTYIYFRSYDTFLCYKSYLKLSQTIVYMLKVRF